MLYFTPEQAFYFALFYILKDIILQTISIIVIANLYEKSNKKQISRFLKFTIIALYIIYHATLLQYSICFWMSGSQNI